MIRNNRNLLNRTIRGLDAELLRIKHQEKLCLIDIRRTAATTQGKGCIDAVKSQAKDLVRNREHISKLIKIKSSIHGVLLKLHTMTYTQKMGEAMFGVAKTLKCMNNMMNLAGIRGLICDYEKQMNIMDMKGELLNDILENDDYDQDDDEEEEEDRIVSMVLDELGLDLSAQLPTLSSNNVVNGSKSKDEDILYDDIQDRLVKLRGDTKK